jgi:SurA-like protein
MNVPSIGSRLQSRLPIKRWQLVGGVAFIVVVVLIVSLFVLRQRPPANPASTQGLCAPTATASAAATVTVGMVPPGVTQPVTLPPGEPQVVATVNGASLYAEDLELRVAGALANHKQALQQAPPGGLPPNLLATLQETPNQMRHDALTQMIQECLLLQEGNRLGLTASRSAAQAMARQQLQLIQSLPASDQARVSFEAYLHANQLTEQTFLTDPRILSGYRATLTMVAVKQHIVKGLPPNESPTAGVNAYVQQLWQRGTVHVYLPVQLGW